MLIHFVITLIVVTNIKWFVFGLYLFVCGYGLICVCIPEYCNSRVDNKTIQKLTPEEIVKCLVYDFLRRYVLYSDMLYYKIITDYSTKHLFSEEILNVLKYIQYLKKDDDICIIGLKINTNLQKKVRSIEDTLLDKLDEKDKIKYLLL